MKYQEEISKVRASIVNMQIQKICGKRIFVTCILVSLARDVLETSFGILSGNEVLPSRNYKHSSPSFYNPQKRLFRETVCAISLCGMMLRHFVSTVHR